MNFKGNRVQIIKSLIQVKKLKSKHINFETNNSDQSDENDMLNSNKPAAELETSGSCPSANEAKITEGDGTMYSAGNYQSPEGGKNCNTKSNIFVCYST